MYAGLRFPVAPEEETEYGLPEDLLRFLDKIPTLSAEEKKSLAEGLRHPCPDPAVLEYRALLAEELLASPPLQQALSNLARLGRLLPDRIPTREVDALRTVARFESFATLFDEFCKTLQGLIPESEGAKRCLRFLKFYAESFEYRELKHKCAELMASFGFSHGFLCAVGNPDEEGTALLTRPEQKEGLAATVQAVMTRFSVQPADFPQPPQRDYSDTEIALLTGMIRGETAPARRLEDFFAAYIACGTEDLVRLSREAAFFTAMTKVYTEFLRLGGTVCRPLFRAPGYYSDITDLCYFTEEGMARADFSASPLSPITVVCGPDAAAYLQSVAVAHAVASVGGLVFAQKAEISPCDRLERDEGGKVSAEALSENSLCLCGNLFDTMLPRQEEAAAKAVLLYLSERSTRSVVRITAQSNLAALQKQSEEGTLPPCIFVRAGTDRTLEDLLKRHQKTEESDHD